MGAIVKHLMINPRLVDEVRELAEWLAMLEGIPAQAACIQHAYAAQRILGAPIVAGSCSWKYTDFDDGSNATHFSYTFNPDVANIMLALGLLPEVHVWNFWRGKVLDFTTRYLKAQVRTVAELEWDTKDPPDYFWGKREHPKKRWAYIHNPHATELAQGWAATLEYMV